MAGSAAGHFHGDDTAVRYYSPDYDETIDADPPPESLRNQDRWWWPEEYRILPVEHQETPELHLADVARQNVWVEGLRTLEDQPADHGPVEVLDRRAT